MPSRNTTLPDCGPKMPWVGNGHHAWLWSAEDATQEPRVLKGHSGLVLSVAFDGDSRRLVTGAGDDTARVWSLADGSSVALRGHQRSVLSAVLVG